LVNKNKTTIMKSVGNFKHFPILMIVHEPSKAASVDMDKDSNRRKREREDERKRVRESDCSDKL